MKISGTRIALYGRFLQSPREHAVRVISDKGGITERDLTRRTNILVIGRGARHLIPSGHLLRKIQAASERSIPVLGESSLWTTLSGSALPDPTFPIDRISPTPDPGLVDMLNAFDIVQCRDGLCAFGDVATLKSARELMEDGHELSSVVRILLRAKDVSPVGRHRTIAVEGRARLKWDDTETELDGQGILPLPEHPTLDDVFEQALLAEAEGDLLAAERGYRLCMQMDKSDPIAPFNLGNVYSALDQPVEAARHFGVAIHRDPKFAEAYYNRARELERSDAFDAAEIDLEAALQLDGQYLDALFNLAQLKLKRGDAETAVDLLNRFLALSPDQSWAEVALKAKRVATTTLSEPN